MNKNKKGLIVLGLMLISSILFLSAEAATVESKINTLNGALTLQKRVRIANAVRKCGLDQNLVLAIIKTESDFVNGALNKRSKDFGLMQVNDYHVQVSNLDRSRLRWDVEYNVAQGCRILSWFLRTYKIRKEAIARYNCGTRLQCVKLRQVRRYVRRVEFWYSKLKKSETVGYHMDKGLRLQIKKTLRVRSY